MFIGITDGLFVGTLPDYGYDSERGDRDRLASSVDELFHSVVPSIFDSQDTGESQSGVNPFFENFSPLGDQTPFLTNPFARYAELGELFEHEVVEMTSNEARDFFRSAVDIPKDLPSSSTQERFKMPRVRRVQNPRVKTETLITFHPKLAEFWKVVRPGEVQCQICQISMVGILQPMNEHLVRHKKTHKIENPYICDRKNCTETAPSKDHLDTHILAKHSDNRKHCLFCTYTIRRDRVLTDLEEHTRSCHLFGGNDFYRCFHCGKSFPVVKNLATHIARHNPSKQNDPTLAAALKPLELASTLTSRKWTSPLLELYFNNQNGLPKETPGFDQKDINQIKKALTPKKSRLDGVYIPD